MKRICSLLVFFFVFAWFSMSVNAQLDDFETKRMSEDEYNRKYSSITISCSDAYKPGKYNFEHITSFSVSDKGLIAVGVEGSWVPFINFFPDDYVVIIDNTGNIVNCIYYTYPHSDVIRVGWHDDNVIIIEQRGGVIIEISSDGEVVERYDVTSEENYDALFHSKTMSKIKVNDVIYEMNKNGFLSLGRYTAISKNSQVDGHRVIFNTEDYVDKSQYIIIFVIIGVFIVESVVILFYVIPRKRKQKLECIRSNQK